MGVAWAGRLWEGSVAAAVPESRGLRSSPWCPAQASHGEARAGAPSAPWSPAGAPCELRGREGSAPDPPVPRALPPSSGSGQGLGVWPRACDSTRQAGLPEGCVRHNGATPWAPASGPSRPTCPACLLGEGAAETPAWAAQGCRPRTGACRGGSWAEDVLVWVQVQGDGKRAARGFCSWRGGLCASRTGWHGAGLGGRAGVSGAGVHWFPAALGGQWGCR